MLESVDADSALEAIGEPAVEARLAVPQVVPGRKTLPAYQLVVRVQEPGFLYAMAALSVSDPDPRIRRQAATSFFICADPRIFGAI